MKLKSNKTIYEELSKFQDELEAMKIDFRKPIAKIDDQLKYLINDGQRIPQIISTQEQDEYRMYTTVLFEKIDDIEYANKLLE